MNFNSRGQAFDVFKLLIAAVIAVAMLAILFPILQSIGIFVTDDPGKIASDLVSQSRGKPSDYTESKEVVFTPQASSLNAKSIAAQAKQGLDTSQICLSLGDFPEDDSEFSFADVSNNVILKFNGSQKRVKIGVVCDDGGSIQQDLVDHGIDSEIVCSEGAPDSDETQTYCVLVLRKT